MLKDTFAGVLVFLPNPKTCLNQHQQFLPIFALPVYPKQIHVFHNQHYTGLLLVVNDTELGKKIPVIIGTNILSALNHLRGKRWVPTVWHTTFRTLTLTARRLRRCKGKIASLHCVQQVTVPPNGILTFDCYPDHTAFMKVQLLWNPWTNLLFPQA